MRCRLIPKIIASLVMVVILGQCGDKGTGGKDNTPPATIADLSVESAADSSITLIWTAPGDDQTTGTAALYDLRYTPVELTVAAWDSAVQVLDELAPQIAGTAERFTVDSLIPASTYWFALKTADDQGNWSAISNTVSGSTTQSTPDTWEKTYGTTESDGGKCVMPVDDGFVIAGWTRDTESGDEDFYLFKVNISGEKIWENRFGGSKVDYAWSVQATPDGGLAIAGLTYSFGAGRSDVYFIYTDATGQSTGEYTFGGSDSEEAFSMVPAGDGGFILAGYTKSSGAGQQDVYLLKVNAAGSAVWQKQYGGTEHDAAHAICATHDGGYVVVGETRSFGAGDRDVYLIKVTATGDSLWSRTFGGVQNDIGYAVFVDSYGAIFIAGATESSGAGEYDAFLLQCDSEGDSLAATVRGGAGIDYALALAPAGDGGYVLAGYTSSFGAGGDDVYLLKVDMSGFVQWEKTFGGRWDDRAAWIAATSDGGYIVTGWTKSSGAGSGDVLLIKTDADGEL